LLDVFELSPSGWVLYEDSAFAGSLIFAESNAKEAVPLIEHFLTGQHVNISSSSLSVPSSIRQFMMDD
jgi:hypothetical protein